MASDWPGSIRLKLVILKPCCRIWRSSIRLKAQYQAHSISPTSVLLVMTVITLWIWNCNSLTLELSYGDLQPSKSTSQNFFPSLTFSSQFKFDPDIHFLRVIFTFYEWTLSTTATTTTATTTMNWSKLEKHNYRIIPILPSGRWGFHSRKTIVYHLTAFTSSVMFYFYV